MIKRGPSFHPTELVNQTLPRNQGTITIPPLPDKNKTGIPVATTMATTTTAPSPPRNIVVLDPLQTAPSPSQKSTFIFLHGLGDDARGTGYALAQQFQTHQKLPYTRWVLPTAPLDRAVGQRCWYQPPRQDRGQDDGQQQEEQDQDGIRATVSYIDSLVANEVAQGVDPRRIVVGGFSQGCAVSLIWGLTGEWRDRVAGVCGLSGYFPRMEPAGSGKSEEANTTPPTTAPEWFFGHGMSDALIPIQVFAKGQERLQQFVQRDKIEGHVYDDLAHEIGRGEIRDIWLWLKRVLQEDQ